MHVICGGGYVHAICGGHACHMLVLRFVSGEGKRGGEQGAAKVATAVGIERGWERRLLRVERRRLIACSTLLRWHTGFIHIHNLHPWSRTLRLSGWSKKVFLKCECPRIFYSKKPFCTEF
jgi:hypothetical protein